MFQEKKNRHLRLLKSCRDKRKKIQNCGDFITNSKSSGGKQNEFSPLLPVRQALLYNCYNCSPQARNDLDLLLRLYVYSAEEQQTEDAKRKGFCLRRSIVQTRCRVPRLREKRDQTSLPAAKSASTLLAWLVEIDYIVVSRVRICMQQHVFFSTSKWGFSELSPRCIFLHILFDRIHCI